MIAKRESWPAADDPWKISGASPKTADDRNKALVKQALALKGHNGNAANACTAGAVPPSTTGSIASGDFNTLLEAMVVYVTK